MKVVLPLLLLLALSVFGIAYYNLYVTRPASSPPVYLGEEMSTATSAVSVIAENLSVPWEVLFLPDGELLVTERAGEVLLVKQGIQIPIDGVEHIGEGGLLGAALHPRFVDNGYVYFFQTTQTPGGLENRVVRYVLTETTLSFDRVIVTGLPGARYHDGGRIAFGPDGYLYVTLGDASNSAAAEDKDNVAGSILRYTDEGDIPPGNPFNTAVYSYGHRNPQGLAWDDSGVLWSTEHGRSGVSSGFDELNRIIPGGNYGWPTYEGDDNGRSAISPVRHSGEKETWAPGDVAYLNGSLYIPGLKGEALYEAVIDGNTVIDWHEHLKGEYGRLRSVTVGPDEMLYVTTSNRDGRGFPANSDDRIIRIDPAKLSRS